MFSIDVDKINRLKWMGQGLIYIQDKKFRKFFVDEAKVVWPEKRRAVYIDGKSHKIYAKPAKVEDDRVYEIDKTLKTVLYEKIKEDSTVSSSRS